MCTARARHALYTQVEAVFYLSGTPELFGRTGLLAEDTAREMHRNLVCTYRAKYRAARVPPPPLLQLDLVAFEAPFSVAPPTEGEQRSSAWSSEVGGAAGGGRECA